MNGCISGKLAEALRQLHHRMGAYTYCCRSVPIDAVLGWQGVIAEALQAHAAEAAQPAAPLHLYRGDCPDETQPDSYDPDCPACRESQDSSRRRAEASQSAAQADMVLVPRLPTPKMLDAAESVYTVGYTGTPTAHPSDVWRAMLAASQEIPNG